MTIRVSARTWSRISWAAAFFLTLGAGGDSSLRVPELCRSAPGLDPAFAHHLLFDDDRSFRRHCEAIGQTAIRDGFAKLDLQLWNAPRESYPARLRALAPQLARCATELAVLYDSPECLRLLEYRLGLGPAAFELNRLVAELHRLQLEVAGPLDAREASFRRLRSEFERLQYEHGLMAVEGQLARIMKQRGDSVAHARLLHSALGRARSQGNPVMQCQYLGEIGFAHEQAGNVDSMLTCYLEGIAVADRHRLPQQAERLRRFLAGYYVDQGRFAMAMHLARQAQTASRRWGGDPFELPMVLWTMERFADLGCWDIVRTQFRRLHVLLRALERTAHEQDLLVHSLRARRLRARLLCADGRPVEAAAIQAGLLGPARRLHGPDSHGPLQAEYAGSLLAAGRAREALEAATRGIASADSFQQTKLAAGLAAVRVRAALASNELELARSALRDLDQRLDGLEPNTGLGRCRNAALDAELALATGRAAEARQIVSRGLRDLRGTLRRLDPGPYSYLALADVEDLREVTHRLLADDAPLGYRFELEWRSLAGRLGRGEDGLARDAPVGAPALESSGTRAIHVVYGFAGEALIRWTSTSDTVRRERLPVNRRECDRLVESAMRMLARDPGTPGAPLPESLRTACSDLGRLLLPRELREGPPARLIVSAEGSIGRLPFEALDAGAGPGYEPVLARHEVVYARPVPPLQRPAGTGTSLILLGGDEARRDSSTLDAARHEAQQVRAWLPGARIVHSHAISKRELLAAWSRASILYVAAHLERSPEAPLLCYFPMTFGVQRDRPEDSQLDLLDARTADLTGCELAVLSSCASGEPYVVGTRSGPSMADALLDAGARAVIHTRWRVRDDRAAVVAPRLAKAWLQAGDDPVASWCEAKRAMLRSRSGWRHPFEWATWSVTVGLPTGPWDGGAAEVTAAAAPPGRAARARRAGNPGP